MILGFAPTHCFADTKLRKTYRSGKKKVNQLINVENIIHFEKNYQQNQNNPL